MSWNAAVFNKLHSIKPLLGEWQPSYRMDRKEEVTFERLRIGHTFITHSFLLKGENWLMCIPCQKPFSVRLRIGHSFITYTFLLTGEDWHLCIPCQKPFSGKLVLLDCTDF